MDYSIIDEAKGPVIKVIGMGGCGGNAVNHMVTRGVPNVEFIAANTDLQDLDRSLAGVKLQIGEALTRGQGAGADPTVGIKAAQESHDAIAQAIDGAEMLFIAAGMGGGTGTGSASVVAQIAKSAEILTIAVVTSPFEVEGSKCMREAQHGIDQLRELANSTIVVSNEKMFELLDGDMEMEDAYAVANEVLYGAVMGITDIINSRGTNNVDFADVKTVMKMPGMATIGTAVASGEDRAVKAAQKALNSPLVEGVQLDGAKGALVNITASRVSMNEFKAVMSLIKAFTDEDATIIYGKVIDPSMGEDFRVTIVATGLELPAGSRKEKAPPVQLVETKPNILRPVPTVNRSISPSFTAENPAMPEAIARTGTYDPQALMRATAAVMATQTSAAVPASMVASVVRNPRAVSPVDYDVPAFLRKQAD
jgi:cell division protein FtsZ